MERKKWGFQADLFRLIFLAINIPIFFWNFSYNWIFILVFLAYMLIMAIWILRMRNYFDEEAVVLETQKAI